VTVVPGTTPTRTRSSWIGTGEGAGDAGGVGEAGAVGDALGGTVLGGVALSLGTGPGDATADGSGPGVATGCASALVAPAYKTSAMKHAWRMRVALVTRTVRLL
jgi:hypothetical protein